MPVNPPNQTPLDFDGDDSSVAPSTVSPNGPPVPRRADALPISVTELNRRARNLIEAKFELLWVSDELSNVTRAASGHYYFVLKDDAAQVRCVMFRNRAATLAFLSARVGSISDNRLGGWYGYRASKAALNQFVRTLAIELARTRPATICVALHPGTVDTALSGPFQRNVAPGKLFSPAQSAGYLLDVLVALTPADSGALIDWAGERIAP